MKYYLEELERGLIVRNYSASTVKSYVSVLKAYIKFVDGDFFGVPSESVKNFLFEKKKRSNCSGKTLVVYLSALKFFYKEVLRIPFELDVKMPKKESTLPVVLSNEEVVRVIRTFRNLKHRLIVMVAYGSGLRVSEIVNLRVFDLDFKSNTIHIRGAKGRKDRITILSPKANQELRVFTMDTYKNDYVFPSQKGGRLTTRAVQKMFKSGLRRAKIFKRATFHSLRHSFATHLIQNGTPTRYVQELLGHRNIRTTERYTHVATNHLRRVKSPL